MRVGSWRESRVGELGVGMGFYTHGAHWGPRFPFAVWETLPGTLPCFTSIDELSSDFIVRNQVQTGRKWRKRRRR